MGITRIQATPVVSGTGTQTLTFGTTPLSGSVIAVMASSYRNGAGFTFSAADNQGNSYHTTDSGDRNGTRAWIFFAYNITTGSPFTVTLTAAGAGGASAQIEAVAVEFADFGAANPLVGEAIATGLSTTASVTTASTGAPEVAVIAVVSTFRLNFDVTAITVGAQTPAFLQEYEKLASGFGVLAGESDSRIVSSSAAQSASWSISASGANSNWAAAIIALYSVPPPGILNMTQMGRQVAELQGTAVIRMTQMARQVLYPFTCSPGVRPPIRLTQLPLEVAYDYAVIQPFVTGNGFLWATPPRTLT